MIRKLALVTVGIATGVAALVPSVATGTQRPTEAVAVSADGLAAGTTTPTASTTAAACSDSTYTLATWHLGSTFKWYYNAAAAPASIAPTALDAIQKGTQSLVSGSNRCGTADTLTSTEQYMGTTTRVAQVDSLGNCTGNDGFSVASWGTLPSQYLAMTCVYYSPGTGKVLSSDVLIDNKVHTWFTTQPTSCSNAYDLQSVIVHERGHTAGLAHVDQTAHPLQTMAPKATPCSTAKRALGSGDLKGMVTVYTAVK